MRFTKLVASVCSLCLIAGLIIYGGIFLWPRLAGSTPQYDIKGTTLGEPVYLYTIGDATGPLRPNCVAVDRKGKVYITDSATCQVYVFSKNGKKEFAFGTKGSGKKEFGFPNGIVITREGNLLIADSTNKDIKLFSPKGKYIKTVYQSEKVKPGYMSGGEGQEVYVSDLAGNQILVMSEQGKVVETIQDKEDPLKYPQAAALDKQGRLWVADSGNYAVKILNSGKVIKKISGAETQNIPFSMVKGITFDKAGRAYVSDTISHQIRIFDANGNQLKVFPDKNTGSAQQNASDSSLVYPTTLFMASSNHLFVVDRGTAGIKVFKIES